MRSPGGWKEAGFDTSPKGRKPFSRKVWMEVYVGHCLGRLNTLKAAGVPDERLAKMREWMLDPQWIGER